MKKRVSQRESAPRAKVLCRKATAIFRTGEIVRALSLAHEAVDLARDQQDNEALAESLYIRADCQFESGDYEKAIEAVEEGILLREPGPTEDKLKNDGRWRLALIQMRQGQFEEAKSNAGSAFFFADVYKILELGSDSRAVLGLLFEAMGERSKALVWLRSSLKLAKESGHIWRETSLYSDLGRIHGDLHEYTVALDYLDQGEELARERGFKRLEMLMLRARGDIHAAVGDTVGLVEFHDKFKNHMIGPDSLELELRVASYSMYRHEFSNAIEGYKKVISEAKQNKYLNIELAAYMGLGTCLMKEGQLLTAFECISKIFERVNGQFEYNMIHISNGLEKLAVLLRKLRVVKLAARVETICERLKVFEAENSSGVAQRSFTRHDLLEELSVIVYDILHVQFGQYEARGVRVNTVSREVFVKGLQGSKKLTKCQIKVFNLLFNKLDKECTNLEIFNAYCGDKISEESLNHRVHVFMSKMREKGLNEEVLQVKRGDGYRLVSK